jgi:CopG family nickel-responsive transcriptional regulator
VATINISLPDEMMEEIHRLVEKKKYTSRSELVREALRSFFSEEEWRSRLVGESLVVVTVTYHADQRGVNDKLNQVQHKKEELILATLHGHLRHRCVEVILTRGEKEEIRDLVEALQVIRGVEIVKITPV